MWFYLFILFFNKAKEQDIKFKRKPVRLKILNHIINSLNINISEDINVKARKILPVDHQFLFNDIFPPSCNTICFSYPTESYPMWSKVTRLLLDLCWVHLSFCSSIATFNISYIQSDKYLAVVLQLLGTSFSCYNNNCITKF